MASILATLRSTRRSASRERGAKPASAASRAYQLPGSAAPHATLRVVTKAAPPPQATTTPQAALDLEAQRRQMSELVNAYRDKIGRLELQVTTTSSITTSGATAAGRDGGVDAVAEAVRTVGALRESFKASLEDAEKR